MEKKEKKQRIEMKEKRKTKEKENSVNEEKTRTKQRKYKRETKMIISKFKQKKVYSNCFRKQQLYVMFFEKEKGI